MTKNIMIVRIWVIGLFFSIFANASSLFENFISIQVKLPYKQGNLISLFHRSGRIDKIEQGVSGVSIKGALPGRLIADYLPFSQKKMS